MRVLPSRRAIVETQSAVARRSVAQQTAAQQHGQTLGRGMDFALVVLVFLGIGYGLDRWLDTRPAFMIGLVVLSVVGQFIKMYFEYTATMEHLEAERSQGVQAAPRRQA